MWEGADNEFGLSDFRGYTDIRVIRYLGLMTSNASVVDRVCPHCRVRE